MLEAATPPPNPTSRRSVWCPCPATSPSVSVICRVVRVTAAARWLTSDLYWAPDSLPVEAKPVWHKQAIELEEAAAAVSEEPA